mgnify:CR=1 FL=1
MAYVPNLRFRSFSENWTRYCASDLLESVTTNSLTWDDLNYDSGIVKNIHYGLIHKGFTETCISDKNPLIPWINGEKALKNYTLVGLGDLILADASEDRKDVGKPIEIIDTHCVTVSGLHTIHAKDKTDYFIPGYKGFYFQSSSMKNQIYKIANGSKIYGISPNAFNELYISIPNKNEQAKIVDLLIKIEERISTQNKIIEDYSLLKDSIIHQTFSMDYTKVKLSALLTEVSVRNKEEHINNVLSVSNKLGFIKQSEQFEDREVASNDTSNYKIVSKGDYAYNPARINVGSIARLIHYDKGIISPMYSCFRIDLNKITYTYFDMFLNSSSFNRQLNKRLEGSVRQCLTFEGMLSMSIELPPIEIQKSISDKIDMLNDIIKIEIDYRTALIKQKQYLLNNLFI